MRVRIILSGILAGVMCLILLWFQYYTFETGNIVPGWSNIFPTVVLPGWFPNAILILCGITLFTFGWVAARWNWAANWKASLLAGGSMGIIAGCLIYDFIGTFWFSLKGQEEILTNFYITLTEAEGMKILLEAILQTGTFIYLNFVWIVLACAALGAVGGLASAVFDVKDFWGNSPRKPEGWLFRLPAYMLTIFGCLNLIVTIAVLSILWDTTTKSLIDAQQKYNFQWNQDFSSSLFYLYGYLVGLILIFLPIGITWGWIIRAWLIREKPGVLSALWIAATTAGISYVLIGFFTGWSIFSPRFDLISIIVAFVLGIIIGLITEDDSEGFSYHFSDWVGYSLTYGILGGTQIVMGVLAYAMATVLISIVNIPHLLNTGVVQDSPAHQVVTLYTMQTVSASVSILVSILIGLLAAILVSFGRTIIGVKDRPPQPH